jgi:transposase
MELTNVITVFKDSMSFLLLRIESLESQLSAVMTENADLRSQVAALTAENADLRSRLNLNSENSHKPPSSDGLSKKPGLPKAPSKKNGGQYGHKGSTLTMVKKPDKVVVHHAPCCPCCSRVFSESDVVKITQKRQVFDIPEPRMEVVEHQLGLTLCCGRGHIGNFPLEVAHPVQYGSRIKALSVLLNNEYKVPLAKIEQLMDDLWGCTFNQSTVVTANAAMYQNLEPIVAQIKTEILASDVVHFDETGMRVTKSLYWFHVAATSCFTYLFVHKHRGLEAMQSDESVLKDFSNRAIHDCWESYFSFEQCKHGLCNTHLLRELTNLVEKGSKWAIEMHQFILELYLNSQKASVVVADRQIWERAFKHICQIADKEEPTPIKGKRGRPKSTKGRSLLNRLVKYQNEWLAFAFVENVPFSNNQAERDIRCLKTKQKVATNFQTEKGAKHFAQIQSFTSTLRKHSMNVYQNLINVFNGENVTFQRA